MKPALAEPIVSQTQTPDNNLMACICGKGASGAALCTPLGSRVPSMP